MNRKRARTIVMDEGVWIDRDVGNGITHSRFVYSKRLFPVFKVLRKYGNSSPIKNCIWPIPRNGKPGKWMVSSRGRLKICVTGLHLTTSPLTWGNPSSHKVYLAEYEVLTRIPKQDDKFCVRRARLLRRISWREATRLIKNARIVK